MFTKEQMLGPIPMYALAFLGAGLSLYFLGEQRILPQNDLSPLVFLVTMAYWFYVYWHAVKINHHLTSSVEVIDRLATSGIYAHVRHPIYSAHIVLAWGIFFAFPLMKVLVSVLWLMAVFTYWAFLEDGLLEKKFGTTYLEYRRQVPMLVPMFFRSREQGGH
jgi:protein-S-isoprenylcysteine O-methyltransferase Ste14